MNGNMLKIGAICAGAVLFIVSQSVYVTNEAQTALVERFGDIKKVTTKAGLSFKIPFIDNVKYLDKRILNLESAEIKAILSDKKQLVVDAFARYQITDPKKFYQAVSDERIAADKISVILDSATRQALGKETLTSVLSGKRLDLMDKVEKLVDRGVHDFGVNIVDVRIRRADLPLQNSESVFKRMKAERNQQAAQFRAEGQQKAVEVRSLANRNSEAVKAEARKDAEIIRGEGDAQRSAIYAEAFSGEAEFYDFYRSMIAYERSFAKDKNTNFVITPEGDFMKNFYRP